MKNIVEATAHYEKAYAAGIKQGGQPAILKHVLEKDHISATSEYPLGIMQIPLEQVIGTYDEGRKDCFSSGFLPTLKKGTEFSSKWIELCSSHLEEGINTPVLAYEYMNLYYIKEGNKRVSVLSYFEATTVAADVIRIVPPMESSKEAKINFEYFDFFHRTKINYIYFTTQGSFYRLLKLTGKSSSYKWTDDDRINFKSVYSRFRMEFDKLFEGKSYTDASAAFLTFLSLYDYNTLVDLSAAEIHALVIKCQAELASSVSPATPALVLDPQKDKNTLLQTLLPKVKPELKVGFIYNKNESASTWTGYHFSAAQNIQRIFGDKVKVMNYTDVTLETIDAALEKAAADGCKIIFTTTPIFLKSSKKFAIDHTDIKVLNCSVNKPTPAVRTYYARMYEVRFLLGAIAASVTPNNRIGYITDYPIYGTISGVNAFALGAQMVNPDVKIYLNWSTIEGVNLDEFLWNNQLSVICGKDAVVSGENNSRFGLYRVDDGVIHQLAVPIWNWSVFYEKAINSVLKGTWKADEPKEGSKGITYWWGLSSEIVSLICSTDLPIGTIRLYHALRDAISNGTIQPFNGPLLSQDGTVIKGIYESLTPDEIINMDWLCDNIIGTIPESPELTEEARILSEVQGVRESETIL